MFVVLVLFLILFREFVWCCLSVFPSLDLVIVGDDDYGLLVCFVLGVFWVFVKFWFVFGVCGDLVVVVICVYCLMT